MRINILLSIVPVLARFDIVAGKSSCQFLPVAPAASSAGEMLLVARRHMRTRLTHLSVMHALKPGSRLWNIIKAQVQANTETIFTHFKYKHKKMKNTHVQSGLCVVFFAYACFMDVHTGETNEINPSTRDLERKMLLFLIPWFALCLCSHHYSTLQLLWTYSEVNPS